ncbi:MAG TPA: hypothetical protein VK075_06960 [Pseudogracilibacillus sp.]|nr:hypothetical protein [Pseudogracilibacillus sp.]
MNKVQKVYDITESIHQLLFNQDQALERQQLIEQVNELIDQRQKEVEQLAPPYTEEEMKLGQKTIQFDKVINEKLTVLFKNIQDDMKEVQQRKVQTKSYINPYGKLKTTDGMYLDSKQ